MASFVLAACDDELPLVHKECSHVTCEVHPEGMCAVADAYPDDTPGLMCHYDCAEVDGTANQELRLHFRVNKKGCWETRREVSYGRCSDDR